MEEEKHLGVRGLRAGLILGLAALASLDTLGAGTLRAQPIAPSPTAEAATATPEPATATSDPATPSVTGEPATATPEPATPSAAPVTATPVPGTPDPDPPTPPATGAPITATATLTPTTPAATSTSGAVPSATALPSVTASPTPPACAARPLGIAADYTLFILGDLDQQGTESRGRVAVAGDARLRDYGVGLGLAPPEGTRYALVVGGDLAYTNGAVGGGDVVYGGAATITAVELRHGRAYQGRPLDFGANAAYLRQASGRWAALTSLGPALAAEGESITLRGDAPTFNSFSLSAEALARASSLTIVAPAGSTALVNVSGAAPQFAAMRVALEGVEASHVLFNLHEAERVTITGAGLPGTVLAPRAAVAFDNAGMDGTLIGASLTGSGETRLAPFAGCLPSAGEAPEQPPAPTAPAPTAPATATLIPTAIGPAPLPSPPPAPDEGEEDEEGEEEEREEVLPTATEGAGSAPPPSAGPPGPGAEAPTAATPAGGAPSDETLTVPSALPNTGGLRAPAWWATALAAGLMLGGSLLVRRGRGARGRDSEPGDG